jgi:hypothetical protein
MQDEVQDGTAVLARVEYDRQVATAKLYPRSLDGFRKESITNATLTAEIARACIYALPREDRESGRTKVIDGPSARFAELILSAWGNCAAGARIVREDAEFVYAQGVFIDLEKNVKVWREVSRRITTRDGRRYSADMVGMTANAAGSIASRNATLAGIPRAFWWEAYERAKKVVAGDAETFDKRRAAAVDTARKMGLTVDRIYNALGVTGIADIGIDEYVTLEALMSAVREGEANIDTAFPDPADKAEPEKPGGRGMSGLKERVRKKVEAAKAETKAEAKPDPPKPKAEKPGQQALNVVHPMCKGCGSESDPRFTFAGEHYCEKCNPNRAGHAQPVPA